MKVEEAIQWVNGERSIGNIIPQDPFDTWQVRIAQADAAMTQRAYWTLKAQSALADQIGARRYRGVNVLIGATRMDASTEQEVN